METFVFWWPAYRLAGCLKLMTAVLSWGAVFALFGITPQKIAAGMPVEWEVEIARRRGAESMLLEAHAELEQQVLERTQALEESEATFRQLADSMPQIVWTALPNGRAEYLNVQWFEYTGLPIDNDVNQSWTSVLHPDDAEKSIHLWRVALQSGQPYEVEYRLKNGKSGEYRWHLSRARAVRDGAGRIIRWYGTATDIDDRKRAEERLQESERLYRAIGESIDYGVWVSAPDGRNTYASPSFLKLTGVTQEQCSGFGWSELVHPNEAEEILDAWKRCVQGREKWDREQRVRGADGLYHSLLVRGAPVEDEHGNLLCWAGINLDISRQKQAEESLRELNCTLEQRVAERTAAAEDQRRLLDAILDALPVAVIIANPDGRLIRLNRACEKVWGIAPLSNNIAEYREWVGYWLESGRRIEPHEWALSRALLNGESCPGELLDFVRFGDGSRRIIMNSAAPVWGSDGEIMAGVVASMDVTDRMAAEAALRESEERFRSAFDDAPTGMAMVALDGRFLRGNRSLCQLLGYSEQEILATNFQSISFPYDLSADLSYIEEMMAGRVQPYQMEKRYFHKRGHTIHTQLSVSLVRNNKGEPLYSIKHIQDISERKRAEERTQASLREKETLLREIHHRVKNNLQIVSTLLDLQSGHTTDEQALKMFKESRGRVKSMALIHERLYRSKDMGHVDFAEYVRQLADDLNHAYTMSEVRLEITVDIPPLNIDIAIPCGLLLNELMTNCLKHAFTNQTDRRIQIAFHGKDGINVLSVADNGAGFPPDVDFQNSASFGLQLVKTLVDQLKGWMTLKQVGGTEIIVRFPDRREEE